MRYQFRVWNLMSKKMMGWGEIFDLPAWEIFPGTPEQRAFNVMQYTGLKDKNGKEIYEGDVVDTVYDGKLFTGVVVYDESELDFKATNGKENYGSNFQYLPCCDEVEIIGNIYENPELLKTK
ncbi:YopX family protein [Bacillus cereus]